LAMGHWGFAPTPTPQSPIPNPQSPIPKNLAIKRKKIIKNKKFKLFLKNYFIYFHKIIL